MEPLWNHLARGTWESLHFRFLQLGFLSSSNDRDIKLKMSSKCVFNSDWTLSNPDWAKWLKLVPNDKFSAQCLLCRKSFTLSNMGRQVVESHAKSMKHQKLSTTSPSQTSLFDFNATSSSATASTPRAVSTPAPASCSTS